MLDTNPDSNQAKETSSSDQQEVENSLTHPLNNESDKPSANLRRPRLWPLWIILGLYFIICVLIISGATDQLMKNFEHMRQQRVMHMIMTTVFMGGLVGFWFVFLSRLKLKTKMLGMVAIFFCGAIAFLFFRVQFSGDLVPLIRFRWERKPGEVEIVQAVKRPEVQAVSFDPSIAGDFTQFRGSQRDGVIQTEDFTNDWNTVAPQTLWRIQIGAGWSSFSVRDSQAVTLEQRDEEEWVSCYDLATGQLQWANKDRARHDTTLGGLGPRSTPILTEDHVFALGATGILNCLLRENGQLVWSRNLIEELDAQMPVWGIASSPLVIEDHIYIGVGGEEDGKKSYFVALNAKNGQTIWQKEIPGASYSSPVKIMHQGKAQLVNLNQKTLAAFDFDTGEVLWEVKWPGTLPENFPKVAMPIALPNNQNAEKIFVSADYGYGSHMFDLASLTASKGKEVKPLWQNKRFRSKFTNVFHHDGFIYTLSGSRLAAANVDTGKLVFRHRDNFGHGQLIMVKQKGKQPNFIIQCEDGDLALVTLTADKAKTLSRLPALNEKTWNPPCLAGRYLILRNHMEAVCYVLPGH